MSKLLDMWAGLTGVVMDYALSTAPTGWLLCYGQVLTPGDATTAVLRQKLIDDGYPHGQSGSDPKVPDGRDRVIAGKGNMGGTAAGLLTVTLTGTRASTSNGIITGLSSTAGLAVGMSAIGTGIGTNAVISSIDSSTQVTLSVNSTSTGSGSIRFCVVDSATLGASGGSGAHTLITGQMPAHTHNTGTMISGRNTSSGGGEKIIYDGTSYAGTSTGGGQAHPNVQPTLVLNKIIKL